MRESLNKSQIERFSRQLVLKNIGAKGQKKILSSKILIVGVGGLGCPAAENLVRAGVGTIGLVDNDIINLSNIHRQSLFTSKDIKKSKVSVAAKKLREIKYVIVHYTGMKKEKDAIKRLCDYKSKVSCHYFIRDNGEILTLVPELYVAWHAGKSKWKKFNNLNKFSIGIELVNKGHKFKYENFSFSQVNKLIKLCKKLSESKK